MKRGASALRPSSARNTASAATPSTWRPWGTSATGGRGCGSTRCTETASSPFDRRTGRCGASTRWSSTSRTSARATTPTRPPCSIAWRPPPARSSPSSSSTGRTPSPGSPFKRPPVGELAGLYREERGLELALTVVPCRGWRRRMFQRDTGLPWIFPSPNMPTPETALVYPGMCLLEGTNLSEGRGTTRPFEMFGAPWLDSDRLAEALGASQLPGVRFRPASFVPTWDKHAGVRCHGVEVVIDDRDAFRPFRTGIACVAAAREREALEHGRGWRDLAAEWEREERIFRKRRSGHLRYE